MTQEQLKQFMNRHSLTPRTLADVLGVKAPAVDHWVTGRRTISITIARCCRLFDKYPQLIKEFHG